MFNLLMQYQPWDPGRDTVPVSRVFEYTDESIAMPRLIEHPCLFMREGTEDEVAYVGYITRAKISGQDVAFEYAVDSEVPPLLNRTIVENKISFDMPESFEFSRTHWAVKDVDLYRVLLRLVRPRRQRPTAFSIPEHEKIEAELVAVMMPFDPGFDEVYKDIQEAAGTAGLRCRRADEIWEAPAIIQDVVSLIDRARVVVCDCSNRNPNVFYEVGIAHTLGREVVLLAQRDADVPFDLRHLRYIQYRNNPEGRKTLVGDLGKRLQAIATA